MLIVNTYVQGIADYLTSIQQEVVVLFDEFDKTFHKAKDSEANDPQAEMLTLFDGLSQGKKLFIVTCNELRDLNDYLVNRPGRFHYHFRFDYPNDNEIREYLMDKIPESSFDEINAVVEFAHKVNLNYDCLRSIAFELSCGLKFEEAIKDLNILNLSNELYELIIAFDDGTQARLEAKLDLFDNSVRSLEFKDIDGYFFYVKFNPIYSRYDSYRQCNNIDPSKVILDWQDSYYNEPEDKPALEIRKQRKCECLLLNRKGNKSLHYAV